DDDDDDITTPGTPKADTNAEMEISPDTGQDEVVESTEDEAEAAPLTDDATEEAVDTPRAADVVDVTSDEKPVSADISEKSKTGLIVGIAAGMSVALIAGGYFMFSGSKPDITTEDIASVEVMVEEDTTDEASSTPTEMLESAAEEEQAVEAVTETAAKTETIVEKEQPIPESTPAPKLSSKNEFQDNLKDGGKAPVMVVIPAGSFEMGGSSSSRFTDERPRHTVNIKSFAVSKYEVTFVEYDRFAKASDRKLPDDLYMDRKTHPVIYVKWDDAYYYVKWLSEQTGKKYRLLSESEWEYAASTGTKSSFWWGYNEEIGKAHCFGCETGLDPRKPSKVGGFEANKFGLHDTAGNVAEWVRDCWHENYKGAPNDGGVWEGGDCTYRTVRGGAYISPQQSIRSAKRDKLKSDAGYDHVGIRIARELD
ncbi:MAG: SUMF1/EgtB/PvdO family nonheme iron enzyme, partial [Proteobacteria bacterium]|nr:SUMF1/EgtB/PvdO family nonheme iron enzyme [Pseudomonadota bacterium]